MGYRPPALGGALAAMVVLRMAKDQLIDIKIILAARTFGI